MKIAFPTDEHFPYQDDRAREVAMMVVQHFQPDMVVVGSDGMDFYDISTFDKDPGRVKVNLQREIDLWKEGVKEWRMAAPQAEFRFIPGNHEDRFRKWLWRHPEIADLDALQLENLLDLKGLGITFEPKDYRFAEIELFGKLVIRHGKRRSGASELASEHYSVSTCTGHTHRGSTVYATTRQGMVIAQECFCLCRLDPSYIAHPNWQQGIVLIDVNETNLHVDPVVINNFQRWKIANWHGEEYRA